MTEWQSIETAPHDRPTSVCVDGKPIEARWRVPAWDDTGLHGYWMAETGKVEPTGWSRQPVCGVGQYPLTNDATPST